jgi:STE24 endopeptidase
LCVLLMTLAGALIAAESKQPPITFELPPDRYEQAVEFHRRMNVLHFAGVAWELLALALMLRLRLAARVRDRIADWRRGRLVQGAAVIIVVFAAMWLWSLPVLAYRHHVVVEYGLSIQRWGPWFADWIKAGLLTGIPGALIVLGFFGLARRSRQWWLSAWGLAVGVTIVATYLVPLFFDPLFFDFRPLAQTRPDLVQRIEAVVARAGMHVPPDRIYEMNASVKTPAVNAYMTGFGSTKRIVVWDTTIRALTAPEIQTVFAHELGHYALHHIPISIAISAAGLLIGFWLLNRILQLLIARRGAEWRIRGLDDYAALPLALLIASLGGFFSEPLVNSYSRWREHQADIYELEAMHGLVPDAGRNSAKVTLTMARIDLDNPAPGAFVRFWLYDHPPAAERIQFAQRYDPWAPGRSPKYVK